METYERIKLLRTELEISQEELGKKLGVSRSVIANIEYDRLKKPEQKEPIYRLICEKFNVNEEWLRYGNGEIFKKPTNEVGYYVEELLDYESNPLYDIIIDMMKKYHELDEKSQVVVRDFFDSVRKPNEKKKED